MEGAYTISVTKLSADLCSYVTSFLNLCEKKI